jgi:hypothetical protein
LLARLIWRLAPNPEVWGSNLAKGSNFREDGSIEGVGLRADPPGIRVPHHSWGRQVSPLAVHGSSPGHQRSWQWTRGIRKSPEGSARGPPTEERWIRFRGEQQLSSHAEAWLVSRNGAIKHTTLRYPHQGTCDRFKTLRSHRIHADSKYS